MRRFAAATVLTVAVLVAPGCGTDADGSGTPDAARAATDAGVRRDGGITDAGGLANSGPVDSGSTEDAGIPMGEDAGAGTTEDAGVPIGGEDAGADAGCSVDGAPGQCVEVSDCAAMSETSTPGYCPGPADIQCCTMTPNVADNPPVPTGWMLMQQSQVTTAMTNWAVEILDDPQLYPMFSTTIQTFGTLMVLARIEWHPPDFQNAVVHRGVTLYVPE